MITSYRKESRPTFVTIIKALSYIRAFNLAPTYPYRIAWLVYRCGV